MKNVTPNLPQQLRSGRLRRGGCLAAFVALAGAGACTSDPSLTTPDGGGTGPLYAVAVNVYAEQGSTTYLTTTTSIEQGAKVVLDDAHEIAGNWGIIDHPNHKTIWLADDESPIIQRWELGSGDKFQPGTKVDFSGLGITSAYQAANGYFSPTRGAFINTATGKLVVWNPETMSIEREVALDIPDREGVPGFVRNVVGRDDGTLIASYYYIDNDGILKDGSGILVLDAGITQVIARDEITGCSYQVYAGKLADGTLYYTTAGQWVLPRLVFPTSGPYMAPACTMRILPGQNTYDRAYGTLNLATLTGGLEVAGSLVIASDSLAFFVGWHNDLIPTPLTQENFSDLGYSAPGWKWYSWDLEAAQATEIPGAANFGGFPWVTEIDGRLFYQDQTLAEDNGGLGKAPFFELTPTGIKPAIEGRGFVYGLMRVR